MQPSGQPPVVEWLAKADEDFGVAEHLARTTTFYASVVYNCQQSAEKVLKAYLVSRRVRPRRTHDLGELVDTCIPLDPSFSTIRQAGAQLSPYAFLFRYPGSPPGPFESDAQEALRLVRQIRAFVAARLTPSASP
jgi:HEPN domain-containing protein